MCEMCLFASADANDPEASVAPQPLAASASGSTYYETSDAAASAATGYSIEVGDRFEGELSNSGDADWIELDLEAGVECVFNAFGTGYYDGLSDPVLTLYDADGNVVARNDNVAGDNDFSLIEYEVLESGTYYLAVTGAGSGEYVVEAATSTFTVEQVVTQITEFGWGINGQISHDTNTGGVITVYLGALTAGGRSWPNGRWRLGAMSAG